MNKISVVFSTLLLTGCAITPEEASRRTSFELCEMTYRSGGTDTHRYNVQRELENRRYDCRGDYPAIAAKVQAEAALLQGLLGAAAVANTPRPAPTFCQGRTWGNGTTMTCY